jgi:hypothetical protein
VTTRILIWVLPNFQLVLFHGEHPAAGRLVLQGQDELRHGLLLETESGEETLEVPAQGFAFDSRRTRLGKPLERYGSLFNVGENHKNEAFDAGEIPRKTGLKWLDKFATVSSCGAGGEADFFVHNQQLGTGAAPC